MASTLWFLQGAQCDCAAHLLNISVAHTRRKFSVSGISRDEWPLVDERETQAATDQSVSVPPPLVYAPRFRHLRAPRGVPALLAWHWGRSHPATKHPSNLFQRRLAALGARAMQSIARGRKVEAISSPELSMIQGRIKELATLRCQGAQCDIAHLGNSDRRKKVRASTIATLRAGRKLHPPAWGLSVWTHKTQIARPL